MLCWHHVQSSLTQCLAKGFGAKPIGDKKGGEDESIMWRGAVRALFPDRLPKEDEVSTTPCPCGSGKSYDTCCLPLHEGTSLPQNAEALLRSRSVHPSVDTPSLTLSCNLRQNLSFKKRGGHARGFLCREHSLFQIALYPVRVVLRIE